ncbi:hypothetical protein [Streptomyces cupreus]|uniref:vWA-MoxR associated protein C-terminal domain-containing protein n=1 Tax=Streptomyces cupreus TaxID=2759956 RepID=A0A7X1J761_9ACTN|nr:hypothetical protein [Streptomyces cupreus]MBC2904397.1 hypothetical protein [Streptomyces cupreus]
MRSPGDRLGAGARPLLRSLAELRTRRMRGGREKWSDLRQPAILGFVLPWELLDEPVEWWSKESDSTSPIPLVLDCPVVVRRLERLQRAAWHRLWRNRWRRLRGRSADSHPHWSRPGEDRACFFPLECEL